jgi:hypothetical protein
VAAFDWQIEVRNWCRMRRDISPALADCMVAFFRQSFENVLNTDRAWFGIHSTGVSLVVGGIYLSAIHRAGPDRGLWMLLSQAPPPIKGLSHGPVKSSRDPHRPLIWAHAETLQIIPELVVSPGLWASYRAAAQQVFTASRSAADRDVVQERRRKHRLSEFWTAAPVGICPDEVLPVQPLVEGAVFRITVNAYERNSEAHRRCIAAHQPRCCACGFDFGTTYGPEFTGFIHVHHLRPLSEIGGEYVVDPVKDLRPVCPNCHAIIHHGGGLRSIEEVRQLLAQQRHIERAAAPDPAHRSSSRDS